MYQMHMMSASRNPPDHTPPACKVEKLNRYRQDGRGSIQVDQHHQNLGADNAGKDGDDAEVPELVGIEALLAAELDDEQQAEDQAKRGHQAIGRKIETAKVK